MYMCIPIAVDAHACIDETPGSIPITKITKKNLSEIDSLHYVYTKVLVGSNIWTIQIFVLCIVYTIALYQSPTPIIQRSFQHHSNKFRSAFAAVVMA